MADKKEPKQARELDDDEKIIIKAKERYKRGRDSQAEENLKYKGNMEFIYEPETQWPEEVRRQRELDMRPVITVPRQQVFVRSVVNSYKQNTSGVKVLPAEDGDKETAEIFTGVIRNIESQSNASQIKGMAFGYAVAGCKGFYRVTTDYIMGGFEQEIKIMPIVNTTSVTYDCDDNSLDGSGWNWGFIEDSLSEEEFKKKYPDEDMDDWPSEEGNDWTQDDGKQIKIAEYFYKELETKTLNRLEDGTVVFADDMQDGMVSVESREAEVPVVKWLVLGGNATRALESKDWAGSYIPIVPVWGDQQYINGKRELYSAMEFSQDSQRMFNFFRSAEVELLSLQSKAPYMVTDAQIAGHEQSWKGANASNQPYLKYNADPNAGAPQRQGFASPPSGVLTGAANAAQDLMDTSGIQEAGLGMQSNETSGRAINARAAQGDKATFQFIDNVNHADRYLGMILVDLIPKIIDTPRVVRTLGLDGAEEMKQVNEEFEGKDKHGNPVNKIYDLTVGRYDVIVSNAPSFASLRQEGQQALAQMAQGNPQLMQQAGDIIMKTMDMPYAEEMGERLKKFLPPEITKDEDEEGEQQLPPEVMQQMEQMNQQMQQMQESGAEMQQELESKQGELQVKMMAEETKRFDAETKRLTAEHAAKDDDLSEQEKIQHESDLKLIMQKRQLDHDAEVKLLERNTRLNENNTDEMVGEIDGEGNPIASELSNAISGLNEGINQLGQLSANTAQTVDAIAAQAEQPKEIVRKDGKIVGVNQGGVFKPIVRDENDEIVGLE